MTTINETVRQAMTNRGYDSYMQYAEPVITDLVSREQEIVGHLLTFAESSELDVSTVRNVLTEAGMHMPPEPTPGVQETTQAQGDGGLAETLGRIEQALTAQNQAISGLTEFARRNGYNG